MKDAMTEASALTVGLAVWIKVRAGAHSTRHTPIPNPPPTRTQNPDANSDDVFLAGTVSVIDGGTCSVKLKDGKEINAKTHDVFAANPTELICPDNTMLIHLNEPSLLQNVRARYEKKDIYTLTGARLIPSRLRLACRRATPICSRSQHSGSSSPHLILSPLYLCLSTPYPTPPHPTPPRPHLNHPTPPRYFRELSCLAAIASLLRFHPARNESI